MTSVQSDLRTPSSIKTLPNFNLAMKRSSEGVREQSEIPIGLFEAERNFRLDTEEEKPDSELKSEDEEEEEVSHDSPQHITGEGTAEGTPEKIVDSQRLSLFKLNHNVNSLIATLWNF